MTHRSKNNSMKSICWKWRAHSIRKESQRKNDRNSIHSHTYTTARHISRHISVSSVHFTSDFFLTYWFAAWFVLCLWNHIEQKIICYALMLSGVSHYASIDVSLWMEVNTSKYMHKMICNPMNWFLVMWYIIMPRNK